MTMTDTSQTNPRPPAADLQPLPVHVVSAEAGVAIGTGPARPRDANTRFSTYVLTTTNPLQNILPDADNRTRAVVIVHSAVGGSAAATSYGWLALTRAAAAGAASDLGEQTNEAAAYISAGGTINVPFEFRGGEAVWACLDNAASTNLTLTVISDYET